MRLILVSISLWMDLSSARESQTISAEKVVSTRACESVAQRNFFSTIASSVLLPTLKALTLGLLNDAAERLGAKVSASQVESDKCGSPVNTQHTSAKAASARGGDTTASNVRTEAEWDRKVPSPQVGIAFTVFSVHGPATRRSVSIAGMAETYAEGEGVALSVSNNAPGIIRIVNIDATGKRKTLEIVEVASPRVTLLPARAGGFYALDGAGGDEKLELQFLPCNGHVKGANESMSIVQDPQVSKRISGLTGGDALPISQMVVDKLPTCASSAQNNPAAAGAYESRSVVEDDAVKIAVRDLQSDSYSGNVQPVVVTIPISRVK